ncbi:toll/interleukin-1 receptor domain-containing protein [Bacillus pseudomycoides]|uniref:toll/interleukin-1 receptor domain-containing protein n=1 Tax=Bacillus pseudomycoides TaxID=64104 RepID=UPI003D65262B
MKVFLSWSGSESRQLATIFKEWLPNVLQYVDPYMSAQDISMGERWGNSITDNLEDSVFGLIFVTPSNIKAPWINFEAGALSKTFESRVIPILYKAEVTVLDQGPLKQFQSTKNLEKESVLSLIQSINESNQAGGLGALRLEKAFEIWWPELEESINAIEEDSTDSNEEENGPTEKDLLNVIYTKLVEQEKTLNKGLSKNERGTIPNALVSDLERVHYTLKNCQNFLSELGASEEFIQEIKFATLRQEDALDYLKRRSNYLKLKLNKQSEPIKL